MQISKYGTQLEGVLPSSLWDEAEQFVDRYSDTVDSVDGYR